jgi:AraC-like DNA-binding protein
MRKKNAKLSEIAGQLGYADQAHLTREFRRHAGIAPTSFQRLYHEGIILENLDDSVMPSQHVKLAFWTPEKLNEHGIEIDK